MNKNLNLKIFSDVEKEQWNSFIADSPWGDLLQYWQWGEAKKAEGWDALRVAVIEDDTILLAAQVLIKNASYLGNYFYVPHGPVFQSVADLKTSIGFFKKEIIKIAKERDCFSIEIEPKIGFVPDDSLADPIISKNLQNLINPSVYNLFERSGFIHTGRNMQPIYKLFYDLEDSEEDLLALMKKNTRYNVKLAAKKGVEIKEYSFTDSQIHEKIDKFYEMLLLMQERAKGYPIRSREYFHKLVTDFAETGCMSLFEASYQGDVISMNISERTKYWSSSFYAASNRLHADIKAPYLMRWQSILKAKEAGCKIYDFWGIIPDSKQHKGYSDNKLSFGGVRINNYGLLAVPLSPSRYFIWNKLLPLRSKIKSFLHF